ncbi:unnamed protein product [Rhizophagus irregularis]|nr:unnamed protein product [Rhizophagus irregularis]
MENFFNNYVSIFPNNSENLLYFYVFLAYTKKLKFHKEEEREINSFFGRKCVSNFLSNFLRLVNDENDCNVAILFGTVSNEKKSDTIIAKHLAKAFYIATKIFRKQPLKCWKFIIGMAKDNNIFTKLKSFVLDVDDDYVDDNDDYDDDDVDDVDDDGDNDDENDVYDDYDDKNLIEWKISDKDVFVDTMACIKEEAIDNLRYDHPLLSFNVDFTDMDSSNNEFNKYLISNSNYCRHDPILCDNIHDQLSNLMWEINKIKDIKIDICNEGTFAHEVGPYFDFLLNFKNVQLIWSEEESKSSKERIMSQSARKIGRKPDFRVCYFQNKECYEIAFCEFSGSQDKEDYDKFQKDKMKLCRFATDAKSSILKKIHLYNKKYFFDHIKELLDIPIILIQFYKYTLYIYEYKQNTISLINGEYIPIGSFILVNKIEYHTEKQMGSTYLLAFIKSLLRIKYVVGQALTSIRHHLPECLLTITTPIDTDTPVNFNQTLCTPFS